MWRWRSTRRSARESMYLLASLASCLSLNTTLRQAFISVIIISHNHIHRHHDPHPKAGYDLSHVTERVSIKMVSVYSSKFPPSFHPVLSLCIKLLSRWPGRRMEQWWKRLSSPLRIVDGLLSRWYNDFITIDNTLKKLVYVIWILNQNAPLFRRRGKTPLFCQRTVRRECSGQRWRWSSSLTGTC